MKLGMSRAELPYSIFYFVSHSYIAHNVAFFPLRCQELGFSTKEIALVGAAATIAVVLGTLGISFASHHFAAPRKLLICSATAALAAYLPLFFLTSFWSILPFWIICTFMTAGAVVLVHSRTIRLDAAGAIVFEHVRLWGSIGFIVVSYLLGFAYDAWLGIGVLSCGVLILLSQVAAAAKAAPLLEGTAGKITEEGRGEQRHFWQAAPATFAILLAALVVHHMAHGAYYAYYSVYVRELGWSGPLISTAWNIGVISEIALFLAVPWLLKRISAVALLRLSLALTVLRWLILGSTTSMPLLLASQTLHAFSYGAIFISSVRITHALLPPGLKDRGQGILMAISGIGGMLGMLAAGYIAADFSSLLDLSKLFFGAAGLTFVSLLISLAVLRR